MAYSKVSLFCGIVAFLLISNGVSARLLDSLSGFAKINLFDDFEEAHNTDAEKSDATNGNSAAAQLPSDKSTLSGLASAPAPAPVNQISETGKAEAFEKETYSSIGSGEMDNDEYDGDADAGFDPAFGQNGTEMDDTDSDDLPLP